MSWSIQASGIVVRRIGFGVSATLAVVVSVLPASAGLASASPLQARSLQMSSSASNADNVIYQVSFTVPASVTVGGMVIDFCSNSPNTGVSCTAPTSLDTDNASTLVYSQSGISGFVVDTNDNQVNRIILTDSSPGSVSGAVSFELGNGTTNGIHNPSGQTTYYARMYTYATAVAAQSHNSDSPSGYADNGSVALSTAAQMTVTAIVQDLLTLCLYTAANCAAGGSSVTLGDQQGYLRVAGPFVDRTTKFNFMTNALQGAELYLKAGLPAAGSATLPSIGMTATIPTAGTSQFGLCAHDEGHTAAVSIAAPYDYVDCDTATQSAGTNTTGGVNGARFAFDTAAVTGSNGDQLATIGVGDDTKGRIVFVGNVSVSQTAGQYTSTFTFIALGHF